MPGALVVVVETACYSNGNSARGRGGGDAVCCEASWYFVFLREGSHLVIVLYRPRQSLKKGRFGCPPSKITPPNPKPHPPRLSVFVGRGAGSRPHIRQYFRTPLSGSLHDLLPLGGAGGLTWRRSPGELRWAGGEHRRNRRESPTLTVSSLLTVSR